MDVRSLKEEASAGVGDHHHLGRPRKSEKSESKVSSLRGREGAVASTLRENLFGIFKL